MKFTSLRQVQFNANHVHPIQDYYLTEIVKGREGPAVMAMREQIDSDHQDAYVGQVQDAGELIAGRSAP